MNRFILTGAPGAGKTSILRQLEMDGLAVVEEAATDVIALSQARGVADPWTDPSFIDAVTRLQRLRQIRAARLGNGVQFHDRSAVCTAALAKYLGYPVSRALADELNRIAADAIYEKRVFFIRTLGFVSRTEARRISLEEALQFERIHVETYQDLGFELFNIPPGPVGERVAAVKGALPAARLQPEP